MEFLFLVALALVCYVAFFFGYKYFKKDAIFVLAIGGVVSSNIYHIGAYPIAVGEFVFGLDSVIYTLFIFCIMFVAIKYSKKEALALTYTSVASILFTAIIQFLASWAVEGIVRGVVWGLVSFVVSAISTLLAVYLALFIAEKLKGKLNGALIIALGVVLVSVINSFLYYGAVFLFDGELLNFGMILASSYIGKALSLVMGIVTYFIVLACEKRSERKRGLEKAEN